MKVTPAVIDSGQENCKPLSNNSVNSTKYITKVFKNLTEEVEEFKIRRDFT